MKKLKIYLLGMMCLLAASACKKNKDKVESEDPVAIQPLVRPKGTSMGPVVSKVIGPAGGVITAEEGSLTIEIPAGALATATTIGLEPITKTNIAAIGQSYRLTPHGQQFEKPITLTYALSAEVDSVALLETLGFAYQMDNGVWKFVGSTTYDHQFGRVTYKTKHFSDWSVMNRVTLSPLHANLEPGEKQILKALIYTESKWEDLLVPLTSNADNSEPGYPVGTPAPLPSKYIKSWDLVGAGNIVAANGHTLTYQAPNNVNGYTNATVSLTLNAPVNGSFILLSNLQITGDGWAELSVGGGAMTKFPVTPAVKSGNRYLLSNPEDEGGGQFLLVWNGGVGNHAYDLTPMGNKFHFLIGNGGYTSSYVDPLQKQLIPSGGSINITKMDNQWVEGNFTVQNAGIGPLLIQTTSVSGRFKARVFNANAR